MRIVFKFDSIFKRLKSDLLIIFSFFIVLRRKTTEDYSLYIKNDLLILRFFWKKREVIFFWNFKWRPQRTPVRHLFPSRGKGGKPSPLGEHFSIIRYELQEERAQRIWFEISHSVSYEIQVSSFGWRSSNQESRSDTRDLCSKLHRYHKWKKHKSGPCTPDHIDLVRSVSVNNWEVIHAKL